MYKDIFAIDEIPFNEIKDLDEKTSPYLLKNYSFFGPKLDKELYYNYFLRTSLFDIDIMELEDFLKFQFDNSRNFERLIKLIEFKVIPDIDLIISTASIGGNGMFLGYNDVIVHEYGFVETDGTIKNKLFDIQVFKAITAAENLKPNLKKRKLILKKLITAMIESETNLNLKKLNWIGKPSHLAFIIRNLIDEGYIDAPIKYNNEINLSLLAKQLMNTFHIENGSTENTLVKYLNPNSEKHQALAENFSEQKFHMPNSGLLS